MFLLKVVVKCQVSEVLLIANRRNNNFYELNSMKPVARTYRGLHVTTKGRCVKVIKEYISSATFTGLRSPSLLHLSRAALACDVMVFYLLEMC